MKSSPIKFLIFGIIFLGILALLFFLNFYFSVKTVQVHGTKYLQGIDTLKGENLILLDETKYEKIFYLQNVNFSSVDLYKQFPQTVIINIKQSKPVITLPVANGFYILSAEGRIIEKNRKNNTKLPIIQYYQKLNFQEYQIGDTISNIDLQYGIELFQKLSYLGIGIDSIDINGLDMILLKKGQVEYVFTTTKSVDEQYQDLKLVLESFKKKQKEYTKIDMRFDKPIVTL